MKRGKERREKRFEGKRKGLNKVKWWTKIATEPELLLTSAVIDAKFVTVFCV